MATQRSVRAKRAAAAQTHVTQRGSPGETGAQAPSAEAAPTNAESQADETREQMIAEAAYYRAEKRGFAPGGEVEDWLAAEAEIVEVASAALRRAPEGGELH